MEHKAKYNLKKNSLIMTRNFECRVFWFEV